MVAGRGEVVPYRGPNQNPLWLWPLRPSLRPRTLPSACPSVRPSIRLCTYPSMFPSILAPVHSSVCTFMHPYTHSCFHSSVYPNTHPSSMCISILLFVLTSVHVPVHPPYPHTHSSTHPSVIHAHIHPCPRARIHVPSAHLRIHPSIHQRTRQTFVDSLSHQTCLLSLKLFAASTAIDHFLLWGTLSSLGSREGTFSWFHSYLSAPYMPKMEFPPLPPKCLSTGFFFLLSERQHRLTSCLSRDPSGSRAVPSPQPC